MRDSKTTRLHSAALAILFVIMSGSFIFGQKTDIRWLASEQIMPRDLMIELYSQLQTDKQTGKAKALQKNQLALLNSKYKPNDAGKKRGAEKINLSGESQPVFNMTKNTLFVHLYYWSPFMLIGNWL